MREREREIGSDLGLQPGALCSVPTVTRSRVVIECTGTAARSEVPAGLRRHVAPPPIEVGRITIFPLRLFGVR